MAKRQSPSAPLPANLSPAQARQGIERIKRRIADIEKFDPSSVQSRWSPEERALSTAIEETLSKVFGHDTIEYRRYAHAKDLDNGPVIMGRMDSPHEIATYLSDGKKASIGLLHQAIKGLEEDLADQSLIEPVEVVDSQEANFTKAIFLVHGHDTAARSEVARFLERIELEVVILNERANEGRTVIEKLEAHGDVGFAVIVLSPDDVGAKRGEDLRPRARQNVILELGYFLGRFKSRARLCVLQTGPVEIPSDWAGVISEPLNLNDGGWKVSLAKELAAAGYKIDWNRVMV